MVAVVLTNFEYRDNAGVVEVGGGLSFEMESPDVRVVGKVAGEDHLERNPTIEANLSGLEDDAHAAAGNLAKDFVIAEIADSSWRGR